MPEPWKWETPAVDPTFDHVAESRRRLGIRHEHLSDVMTVVTVTGEADVYTVPNLRDALLDAIEHGRVQILIEASALESLDSTGYGVLVGVQKRTRTRGGLIGIVAASPRILKGFRITGLVKVFPFYPSLAEAEEKLPQLIDKLHAARLRRQAQARQSA